MQKMIKMSIEIFKETLFDMTAFTMMIIFGSFR